MSKEINKYLNLSIVMSVLFAILGVILVVSPNSSLDTIAYLLAAFLLVYGTYNFIDSFAIHPIFFFMKVASSVISIILGIVIFLNPEIFKNLIPIALGIFFIINGIFKTRMAFIIKDVDNYFVLSVITSVLTIICGIVLIINPSISAIMITTMIGIVVLVYAIFDIVDAFILKHRVKEISKYFEQLLK